MPIKLAKAVTSLGINDEEGLERINISTKYAIMYQIALKIYIYIFAEFQSAIHAITQQNNENYHYLTISDISTKVKSIKYKNLIAALSIKSLKQRFSHLNITFRRGASKTIFLKTRPSALKGNKSKIDPNTELTCD